MRPQGSSPANGVLKRGIGDFNRPSLAPLGTVCLTYCCWIYLLVHTRPDSSPRRDAFSSRRVTPSLKSGSFKLGSWLQRSLLMEKLFLGKCPLQELRSLRWPLRRPFRGPVGVCTSPTPPRGVPGPGFHRSERMEHPAGRLRPRATTRRGPASLEPRSQPTVPGRSRRRWRASEPRRGAPRGSRLRPRPLRGPSSAPSCACGSRPLGPRRGVRGAIPRHVRPPPSPSRRRKVLPR